jgi:deoxyadenosine/deoxycytidine kinase
MVVIIIDGNICSGKTSIIDGLVKKLSDDNINVKSFDEPINDDLLNLYLSDMNKYSMAFQYYVAVMKNNIYEKAIKHDGIAIIDRSYYGDNTFYEYQMNKFNYPDDNIYHSLNLHKDDERIVSIYVNCDIERIIERLQVRSKNEIDNYDERYLSDIEMNMKRKCKDHIQVINNDELHKAINEIHDIIRNK